MDKVVGAQWGQDERLVAVVDIMVVLMVIGVVIGGLVDAGAQRRSAAIVTIVVVVGGVLPPPPDPARVAHEERPVVGVPPLRRVRRPTLLADPLPAPARTWRGSCRGRLGRGEMK